MIDFNEMDKFYIGTQLPIISNYGGMLLEFGEEFKSLLYKIDDDYYADVNHKGRIVQVLRSGSIITSSFVVEQESLVQVGNRRDINNNCSFIKMLTFKKSNYTVNN